MVLRAIRVIRDTAAIPPQPAANASLVAKTRRCRSSRYGPSISNRCRIAASSITNLHTAQTTAVQTPDVENSDSVIVLRPLSTASGAGWPLGAPAELTVIPVAEIVFRPRCASAELLASILHNWLY